MKIKNGWLEAENPNEKLVISKTKNAGVPIDPDYLIIHYTATDTARSAVDWFMNTASNPDKIAAHIVVDLDGTITQLVPFNLKANHAGPSTWDGVDFMNSHGIGIEIVNPGFVEKMPDGTYRRPITDTKFQTYPKSHSSKIVAATHKHKFWTAKNNQYWFKFPDAQLQAVYALSKLLFDTYHLVAALGHDDVSPARKPDPGPAFPWANFKSFVLGQPNDVGKIFKVNTKNTRLRASFSTSAAILRELPTGYEVGLIETNGQWSKVYLVNTKEDVLVKQGSSSRAVKTIGWIYSPLLTLKENQ